MSKEQYMATHEAMRVAMMLSPAMREGICRQPCPSWWGSAPAAMPRSLGTAEALHARGLIVRPMLWRHRAFPLTPLGAAVRDILRDSGRHPAGLRPEGAQGEACQSGGEAVSPSLQFHPSGGSHD